MRIAVSLTKCLVIIALFLPVLVQAVPGVMSYQGKLNDSQGAPVTGTRTMVFTIHDAAALGNALWTETQEVDVNRGIFSVELGTNNPLVPAIFDKDNLYLGIKVGNDTEMVPRQKFTTGAYAFRAAPVTPVHQYVVGIAPTGTVTCVWVPLHSVTVPFGEAWEILTAWQTLFNASYPGLCGLRVLVDGTERAHSLEAGECKQGNPMPNYSMSTGLIYSFSPPLRVEGGQTILFEGYVTAGMWDYKCSPSRTCGAICPLGTSPGAGTLGIHYHNRGL